MIKNLSILEAPILAVLLLGFSWSAWAADNADIYGRWKVAAVLDSADITALDEIEAKQLIGKRVLISKEKFEFDGEVCEAPTYERSTEETVKSFREKGHVSASKMHLPNPVTVIDASCTDLFLKAKDKIVFHWKGVYFDAVRSRK